MKKIFTLIVMLASTLAMQAQDTWTIAGVKDLAGSAWNPEDTNNDMTSTDGVNFTLVKENVMLATGDYEYKACLNHGWDGAIGDGGDNAKLTIEADGAYKVTFTLNVTESALSATATKTGEYVGGETTWTVCGAEELMGYHWEKSFGTGDNQMTSSDGKNWKLVREDVALNKEIGYEFKFVKNESQWFGGENGTVGGESNIKLYVDEPGKYKVTWTMNSEDMTYTVTAEKTGEAEFGEKTWTIAGVEALMGTNWDPTDENNDMTDMEDGTFQLVKYGVSLAAGAYTYKVVANHSWTENYGGDYEGGNAGIEIEADGTYDITFTFNPETKELYATADEATGIKNVKSNTKSSVMYNLQGQRVQEGFRGIVIMNGRKVMMK